MNFNDRSTKLTPSQQSQQQKPILVTKRRRSILHLNNSTANNSPSSHSFKQDHKFSFGKLPNFTSLLDSSTSPYRHASSTHSIRSQSRSASVHTLNISPNEHQLPGDEDLPPLQSQEDANFELVYESLDPQKSSTTQTQFVPKYHNYNNYTNSQIQSQRPRVTSRKTSSTVVHRNANGSIWAKNDDKAATNATSTAATTSAHQLQADLSMNESSESFEMLKSFLLIVWKVVCFVVSLIYKGLVKIFPSEDSGQQDQSTEFVIPLSFRRNSIGSFIDDTDFKVETPLNGKKVKKNVNYDKRRPSNETSNALQESQTSTSHQHKYDESFNVSSLTWNRESTDSLETNSKPSTNSDDYGSHFILETGNNEEESGHEAGSNGYYDNEPNVELEYMRRVFNTAGKFELQMNGSEKGHQNHSHNDKKDGRSGGRISSIASIFNLSEKFRSAMGIADEHHADKSQISHSQFLDDDELQILDEKFTPFRSRYDILKEDELNKESLVLFEEEFKTYQSIVQEKRRRQKLIQELKFQKEQKSLVKKLTLPQLKQVESVLSNRNLNEVVKQNLNGVELRVKDLKTLQNSNWLNDNVIDAYLGLITKRSSNSKAGLPSSFVFTTHFYTTLLSKGYQSVARWAKRKKIDVTKLDYIFVPINSMNTHWSLLCINNKQKKFQYYDSLSYEFQDDEDPNDSKFEFERRKNSSILENLITYMELEDRRLHDGQQTIDFHSEYKLFPLMKSPQQKNGSDCGVFTCTAVEFLSRESFLKFGQQDMPNLRCKMCLELLNEDLLN